MPPENRAGGHAAASRRLASLTAGLIAALLFAFLLLEESSGALARRWLASGDDASLAGPAVALLLTLDLVLPIPSSLVGTWAGGLLGPTVGAFWCWLGLMAGSLLGFAAGERLAPSTHLERRLRRQIDRWGPWAVAGLRLVPILAESSVVLAGAARLPPAAFLVASGLGNLAAALLYAAAGDWLAGPG